MLRRLMLAALALAAFFALESCGAGRITSAAPSNDVTPIVDKQAPPVEQDPGTGNRTGDGCQSDNNR